MNPPTSSPNTSLNRNASRSGSMQVRDAERRRDARRRARCRRTSASVRGGSCDRRGRRSHRAGRPTARTSGVQMNETTAAAAATGRYASIRTRRYTAPESRCDQRRALALIFPGSWLPAFTGVFAGGCEPSPLARVASSFGCASFGSGPCSSVMMSLVSAWTACGQRRPRLVALAVRLDEVQVLRTDPAPEAVVGARALADRVGLDDLVPHRLARGRRTGSAAGPARACAQWTNSLTVKTLSQAPGTRLQMWETWSQDIARIRSGARAVVGGRARRARGSTGPGRARRPPAALRVERAIRRCPLARWGFRPGRGDLHVTPRVLRAMSSSRARRGQRSAGVVSVADVEEVEIAHRRLTCESVTSTVKSALRTIMRSTSVTSAIEIGPEPHRSDDLWPCQIEDGRPAAGDRPAVEVGAHASAEEARTSAHVAGVGSPLRFALEAASGPRPGEELEGDWVVGHRTPMVPSTASSRRGVGRTPARRASGGRARTRRERREHRPTDVRRRSSHVGVRDEQLDALVLRPLLDREDAPRRARAAQRGRRPCRSGRRRPRRRATTAVDSFFDRAQKRRQITRGRSV